MAHLCCAGLFKKFSTLNWRHHARVVDEAPMESRFEWTSCHHFVRAGAALLRTRNSINYCFNYSIQEENQKFGMLFQQPYQTPNESVKN